MRRRNKKMKQFTQLDVIRGTRKPIPQPTVRHRLKVKEKKHFSTKNALEEYYEEFEK